MNTASISTPSQKMSVEKPGPSLVHDNKPKLLAQLREGLRARHYSRRTEQTYCSNCQFADLGELKHENRGFCA